MLHKGIIYLLLCSTLFLSSCSQIELVESPWDQSKEPFVYSVITPGMPVKVYLEPSIPYPDAKVFFIEEGGLLTELTRCENDSNYFSADSILVTKGKTYQIKIELGDGKSPLTAKTTVPTVAAQLSNASYLVNDTTTWFVGSGIAFEGIFKAGWDVIKDKDYGYLLYSCLETIDFVQGENNCTSNITDLFYPMDSVNFKLYLATTDIYLKKWIQNKRIQDNQAFDSGMFFLDVVLSSFGGVSPNFSNVENGIGLFGSYLMEGKTFKINFDETH